MSNKKETRDFYLKIRNNITDYEKNEFNRIIFTKFINSSFFHNYDIFLIYISVKNEVDTMNIIRYLLDNNKKVAVPFCNKNEMSFYFINSFDDLIEGEFGIPSVDTSVCKQISCFENTLCVIPAVAYDVSGYRLGYGGGYYDRFLSANKVDTLGLCYERCISQKLPHEDFDIKSDYVMTENFLRNHKNKEVSTYG